VPHCITFTWSHPSFRIFRSLPPESPWNELIESCSEEMGSRSLLIGPLQTPLSDLVLMTSCPDPLLQAWFYRFTGCVSMCTEGGSVMVSLEFFLQNCYNWQAETDSKRCSSSFYKSHARSGARYDGVHCTPLTSTGSNGKHSILLRSYIHIIPMYYLKS